MGLVAFNVVLCIAKKTVFRLQDGVFLAPVSELPVNVNVKFVFDCGDYAVAVLARRSLLDLKCFHWMLSFATLVVRSFYTASKRKEGLFSFIFNGGG
jgi:hypothetical protein